MSVKIGDVSGCLKVIAFDDTYENEVNRGLISAALTDPNQEYEEMPSSFSKEFSEHFIPNLPFLHHNAKPNTMFDLIDAYKKKKLIRVQCTKCGSKFLTDEVSFLCVKWAKCTPIECSKSTISIKPDYSKNLFQWNDKDTALSKLNSQVALVESLLPPLTYYNFTPENRKLKIRGQRATKGWASKRVQKIQ